jgi:hypothetical protein
LVLWGTFAQRESEGNTQQGIILLDAFAARLDFPALKMKAVEMQDLAPRLSIDRKQRHRAALDPGATTSRHFRAGGQ